MATVSSDSLQELARLIPADRWDVDPAVCRQASRDYFWMSPILQSELADRPPAEAVLIPKSVEELQSCLSWAHRHRIAVTPRGKGTGNFGQGVPMDGGIVIDLSQLNQVISVMPGWIRAQAGCTFRQLEAAANESGQELQLFPSTTQSSLGGFLSGGNGGAGSVNYGMILDDYVGELTVVPCTEKASPFSVQGENCYPYLHAYGTTGLITEATVRLRTKRDWTALFFSFPPDMINAVAAASLEIVKLPIVPRINSFDLPNTVAYFDEEKLMPNGRISLRPMVDRSTVGAVREIVERHGGRFEGDDPQALDLLHTHSFNHPTLKVKQRRPDFCHLQIKGITLIYNLPTLLAMLPEATFHFDSRREPSGEDSFGGILLSRFVSIELVKAAITKISALGLHVIDVHSHHLGGSHPPSLETIHQTRRFTDPLGLLNSGRIPTTATEP